MLCPMFCQAVLGKTKNKSHMTAALMSSKPISLSRSLPQGVIKAEYSANKQPIVHERSGELGHHHQQSRQITKFAPHSPAVHSSLLRSGAENQRAASTQLRNIPAGNDDKHPTEFENAGITDNTAGSRPSELQHLGSPRPGTVKQGVRVAVVAEDGQLEEAKKHQQDQQQQKTGSGTGASLDTIMAKAKIAAENIRLLLHAKVRLVYTFSLKRSQLVSLPGSLSYPNGVSKLTFIIFSFEFSRLSIRKSS